MTSLVARDARLARRESGGAWPLAGIAVLFLAAYAWPTLHVDLAQSWRTAVG